MLLSNGGLEAIKGSDSGPTDKVKSLDFTSIWFVLSHSPLWWIGFGFLFMLIYPDEECKKLLHVPNTKKYQQVLWNGP